MLTSAKTISLREVRAQYQRELAQFVCPIHGVQRNNQEPIGSGFLLKLSAATVLVTAAHVLHNHREFQLQILGSTRAVPLLGEFYYTASDLDAPRPEFDLDIGLVILDLERMAEPPRSRVVLPADLDCADLPNEDVTYGFAGIPYSKNRLKKGLFPNMAYYFGGEAAPMALYRKLGLRTATHFLMNFSQNNMTDGSGRVISAPLPVGISGGPVYRLGSLQQIEDGTAHGRIIAIGIEHKAAEKVLVGVRIAAVVESIRTVLPDLAPELPEPAHVRLSVNVEAS